jgi:hypothetical protein
MNTAGFLLSVKTTQEKSYELFTRKVPKQGLTWPAPRGILRLDVL